MSRMEDVLDAALGKDALAEARQRLALKKQQASVEEAAQPAQA